MRDDLMPYSIKLNPTLKSLAARIETDVVALGLDSNFYRLCVRTNVCRNTAPRYYEVPNPKAALLVMDVLQSEFRLSENRGGGCLIHLQKWNPELSEWCDWIDERGNSLNDYELDENWVFTPVEI